jgi:hypothetical protein
MDPSGSGTLPVPVPYSTGVLIMSLEEQKKGWREISK